MWLNSIQGNYNKKKRLSLKCHILNLNLNLILNPLQKFCLKLSFQITRMFDRNVRILTQFEYIFLYLIFNLCENLFSVLISFYDWICAQLLRLICLEILIFFNICKSYSLSIWVISAKRSSLNIDYQNYYRSFMKIW